MPTGAYNLWMLVEYWQTSDDNFVFYGAYFGDYDIKYGAIFRVVRNSVCILVNGTPFNVLHMVPHSMCYMWYPIQCVTCGTPL